MQKRMHGGLVRVRCRAGAEAPRDPKKGIRRKKKKKKKPTRNHPCVREMGIARAVASMDEGVVVQRKQAENALQDVLKLAVPAVGAVIADPLMSVVDTACVGQVSSLHLAALGPNTAVFTFIFQVFAFLGVTMTNIVANNSITAAGDNPEEKRRRKCVSERMLSYALIFAVMSGIACCVALQTYGREILLLMGAGNEYMEPAMKYLRIRALASPAVMIMCVLQGASLGQQDSATPLKIFTVAGLFNLFGDIYLTLSLRWGIAGAAWATLVAQYLGATIFLKVLYTAGKDNEDCVGIRWFGMPKLSSLRPFLMVSSTLVVRTVLQMCAFSLITYRATSMGTITTAAHQVIMQVFWFLSYFPEPLSLAAQSLIARDKSSPRKVSSLSWILVKVAVVLGVLLTLVFIGVLTLGVGLFTSDQLVISEINTVLVPALPCLVTIAVVMICDGVSIGYSMYHVLPRIGLLSLIGTGMMLKGTSSLSQVWWVMVAFFGMRLGLHMIYIARSWNRHPLGGLLLSSDVEVSGLVKHAVPSLDA